MLITQRCIKPITRLLAPHNFRIFFVITYRDHTAKLKTMADLINVTMEGAKLTLNIIKQT